MEAGAESRRLASAMCQTCSHPTWEAVTASPGVAAAVLHAMSPSALDHCLAAHCSAEPAHRALLAKIGREQPCSILECELGEATGAALAAMLVKAAANLHTGMATFESAGVCDKD